MRTIAEMEALTEEQKLKTLKEAKGFSWYDGWRPYCLMCATCGRMTPMSYGFKCEGKGDMFQRPGCGNMIGFDLTRLQESPLNYDNNEF